MKTVKRILIITAIIGAFIATKFIFFPAEKAKVGGPMPGGKTPTSPVTVYVATTSKLDDKLFATGTVLANEEAELKPEISGRMTYLFLPEGQLVKQGTLLLKINDADLKAQLQKINAQLILAVASEARQRKMLKIEGASQQEYDVALSTLNGLKADSAYYEAQIDKTEIRAPFTGIIGIRNVSPGSYVTPATIVGSIQQTNPIKVDFSIPEKYSSLLKANDVISFHIESSHHPFYAKILIKDPKIDAINRSVHYRALTENSKGDLLPGAYVRIELKLTDKEGSIYVPTEAIVPTLKGKKVFVIKNNLAEERIVTDGLRTSDKIQIYEGLKVGDSVVVTGNMQLKAGSPVKVIPSTK